MHLRAIAWGAVLVAACGDGSEFPADIEGAEGALRDLSFCNVDPANRSAEIFTGDLYRTEVVLPPIEDLWYHAAAGLTYYDGDGEAYGAGATAARVQLGAPLDHDPSCDGCGRVIRPLFIEGLAFQAQRICQATNNAACVDFGGGRADKMYMFCDSPFEAVQ